MSDFKSPVTKVKRGGHGWINCNLATRPFEVEAVKICNPNLIGVSEPLFVKTFTYVHVVSLCFTMFHYVSLCFTMFHYVSLCFTMFHYVSLCFTMFQVYLGQAALISDLASCCSIFWALGWHHGGSPRRCLAVGGPAQCHGAKRRLGG